MLNAGARLGYVHCVKAGAWKRGLATDAAITARDPAYDPHLLLSLPAGRITRAATRRDMLETLATLRPGASPGPRRAS